MRNDEMYDKGILLRDILNILWVGIALYTLGTGVQWMLTSYNRVLFLQEIIILPLVKFFVLMVAMEILIRRTHKYIEYTVMIGINAFVCIIIMSLYDKVILIVLLIFPVLVSLFFYNKKVIRFSVGLSLLTFSLICLLYEPTKTYMDTADLIIIICILIGLSLLINSLMKHSRKVMRELVKTTNEKNVLFSKNIQMEKLSRLDSVTMLYNHRSFHEQLDSIVHMETKEDVPVFVAVLDIDNFKKINDTYGHRAGDRVIIEVANQIKSHTTGDEFPARYGGEEFAIISIGSSKEELFNKMESIRRSIESTRFPELHGRNITISIGMHPFIPGMDKEELFNGADAALYTAKRTGKNRTFVSSGLPI